ncbi:MAG: hypothetical protein ACOCQC_01365 [Halanaerobiaceae bacterium]
MKQENLSGIELYYRDRWQEEAVWFKEIYLEIFSLVEELWAIGGPETLKVYILSSSLKFFFSTLSPGRKFLYGISLPLWYPRMKKIWAGWKGMSRGGETPAVLIKPRETYGEISSEAGKLIYKPEDDQKEIFRSVVCFQLTGVCISHLDLPRWLEQGIIMFTSEQFLGYRDVKEETLEFLQEEDIKIDDENIFKAPPERVAYNHIKGYWTVCYLEENHPGFLAEVFSENRGEKIIDEVAKKLGLPVKVKYKFWEQLDGFLLDYFCEKKDTGLAGQ